MPNSDFVQVLVTFLVLLLSLTVHEAAHAWTADRLGDPTARLLGRISLNPAVHIDPIGTILFPLIALTTGAPILGWAKPVPVNIGRLRGNWKQQYMLIAAAGPASNLVLATIAALALRGLLAGEVDGSSAPAVRMLTASLFLAVRLNVLLAVFNMIPVPPLDGGNVLSGLLHGPAERAFDSLRRYGFLILYGLMLSGILWEIVTPPENLLLSWLL